MDSANLTLFPLGCDHAFAAPLATPALVRYVRGDIKPGSIETPSGAIRVVARTLSCADVEAVSAAVAPAETAASAAAFQLYRHEMAKAEAAARAFAEVEQRPFDSNDVVGHMSAFAAKQSQATRDAFTIAERHRAARDEAICNRAVVAVRFADCSTVRSALGPRFADRFRPGAYPFRWVVEAVLLPAWARQRAALAEDTARAVAPIHAEQASALARLNNPSKGLEYALAYQGAEMLRITAARDLESVLLGVVHRQRPALLEAIHSLPAECAETVQRTCEHLAQAYVSASWRGVDPSDGESAVRQVIAETARHLGMPA